MMNENQKLCLLIHHSSFRIHHFRKASGRASRKAPDPFLERPPGVVRRSVCAKRSDEAESV
jgi:hypothetical protein